jgi:sugar O-acyltransferase (sialic acid O-acetyltransferase NeuD family)
MKKQVVILGAGGFGREVLDVIDAFNQDKQIYEPLGFVVDAQYGSPGTMVNGIPILGGFDWLEINSKKVVVTCSVGAPHHRFHLIKRATDIGCSFFSLIHPAVIKTRWVQIGEGVVITAGSILTNQIRIGNHVHINLDCTIGHDAVLQDFTTLAPGVHVSGNVVFGDGCYVGTGANILEKLQIGAWSIIGAGSTITKNVPANSTVVGVPGSVIKTRETGWHTGGE